MSWSYSGDPSTSELDALRFMIGDTDPNKPIYSNEEIQFIIDTYGTNENKMYAILYRQAANKMAGEGISRKLGPQSEDTRDRYKAFLALADYYDALSITPAAPSAKVDSVPRFWRNQLNNPPWPPKSPLKRRCM